jgi:predicted GIY-YIG superfamily endonuclease
MSIEQPPASYPFMEGSVRANAPAESGVYILFSTPGFTWEIIYVGDADDVQKRLLEHLDGDNPCITQRGPTAFITERVDREHRQDRRDSLIGEYDPRCNRSTPAR